MSSCFKPERKATQNIDIQFSEYLEKKKELVLALLKVDISIVNGCQTYLDQCIHDSEFLLVNYSTFRRDRKHGGGGVIVVVKNNHIAEQITS